MSDVISPNSWTVRGRLTEDARSNNRKQSEDVITNFRLAVNEPKFINGEIESRERYYDVTVFDPATAAEFKDLKKGDRIQATGQAEMRLSKWNDRETGEPRERWNLECHVTEGFTSFGVEILETKAGAKEPA